MKTSAVKTYFWQASYGGDSANQASKSTCGSEVETVQAAVKAEATELPTTHSGEGNTVCTIPVAARSTLFPYTTLFRSNASKAGGTVTYNLYSDNKCETKVA